MSRLRRRGLAERWRGMGASPLLGGEMTTCDDCRYWQEEIEAVRFEWLLTDGAAHVLAADELRALRACYHEHVLGEHIVPGSVPANPPSRVYLN